MTGSRQRHGCTNGGRAAAPPAGSPRRFALLGLGLFAALAVLVASFGASSASAYECYSGNPQCKTEASQQVLVNGGEVMPTTTTYFIYWDPKGAPAFPAKYESGIKTFFKGLEHDNGTDQNFYSVLTQYGVKYETHTAKALTDKHPYPAENSECAERISTPCVTDLQIQAELLSLVKEKKLPGQVLERGEGGVPGATKAYFVMLPPGVSACDGTREEVGPQGEKVTHIGKGCSLVNFCSGHNHILHPTSELEFLPYAIVPYVLGDKACEEIQHPNGISDGELTVLAHEFGEMITDPFGTGWTNAPIVGSEEVADICHDGQWATPSLSFEEKMKWGTPLGTAPDGALYNQVIDGRDYHLEQMYSNEAQGCLQRRALPPAVTKLAPAKGPIAGGTKVKITGLNFENPTVTSVSFGKTAATSFTVISPTSITAVSPASAATGAVAVTVTTTGGTNVSVPFTYETK